MRMKKLFILFFSILAGMTPAVVSGQVSLLNAAVNAYNITPQSLCQVTVMNAGAECDATLEVRLTGSSNDALVTVRTNVFRLKQGMNSINGTSLSISGIQYSSSAVAKHIQSARMLPSGYYHYCCYLTIAGSTEAPEELCLDIEGNPSAFLSLVSPFDKDVVNSSYPVLSWTHSEPFNLLATGEFFRLVVVELSAGQEAEAGIAVNQPVFMKNSLLSHQVQYPFDAKKLEPGKRYAWQVQRIASGVVMSKSEAWEFTVAAAPAEKESKYAVLKRTLDGGFFTVEGSRLYFRFEEEYTSTEMQCTIYNNKREVVKARAKNENIASGNINVKNNGYNRFEIDLDELDIAAGYHTMEIKNAKGELFILKFHVQ